MPRSAEQSSLPARIERELQELETLCGRMESALMRRDWAGLEAAFCDCRRTDHALRNAIEACASERSESIDRILQARISNVLMIRKNQSQRVCHYRRAVGERLQLLARWKAAIRSFGARRPNSPVRLLDQLT